MSDFLPAAVAIARAAGDVLMQHFGTVGSQTKGGLDLVTEADLAAERLILHQLREQFPEHGVIAEESATATTTDPDAFTWYVDPLDGTGNFSRGDPHFAVSLGLVQQEQPVLGVVYNPARDEIFTAAPGEDDGQPRHNGVPIQPRPPASSLATATLASDWPWDLGLRQHTVRLLAATAPRVRQTKIRGCATLDLCDVARGMLDAYLHPGCKPWDLAGPLAVNRAIGNAVFTCPHWTVLESQPVVACAQSLQPQLQQLIDEVTDRPMRRWDRAVYG